MKTKKIFMLATLILLGSLMLQHSSCKKEDEKPDLSGTVKDIEGNVYETVKIGTQVWMAENLRSTKYNDGTDIPLLKSGYLSDSMKIKNMGFRIPYNNKMEITGEHYTWYVVSTHQLCPLGWHVATNAEWTALLDYLGGYKVAGGKMKNVMGWDEPNTGADNSSGFNAFPDGVVRLDGKVYEVGHLGDWWTGSAYNLDKAHNYGLWSDREECTYTNTPFQFGLSVRCMKN